jgi:hypothetical protein
VFRDWSESRLQEAVARARVRKAEDNLGEALRSSTTATVTVREHLRGDVLVGSHERVLKDPEQASADEEDRADEEISVDGQVSAKLKDDRLTLAALWDLTHGRLDLYHTIVTRQARRSFWAAQAAMGVGFVLLVVFAIVAAQAKTTTAAISTGSLGAVGAAFAAYIGRTFIRSQESAASHLRAYFDQPLELSRYLAAERLLADGADLTAEQRAAILSTLVQAIATAGRGNGNPRASKPKDKRTK